MAFASMVAILAAYSLCKYLMHALWMMGKAPLVIPGK
jgi:hypothetical protein